MKYDQDYYIQLDISEGDMLNPGDLMCQQISIRTARKAHVCFWCSNEIPKGEKYRYEKALFEGQWEEWKICIKCLDKELDERNLIEEQTNE